MKTYTLKTLNSEDFSPYGIIMSHTFANPTGRDFHVVSHSSSTGWCLGILELKRNVAPYLERHLYSKESHEPLEGTSILIVARPDTPDDYEIFLLDQPVCLNEGVWHQAMALSEKAVIKVVENLEVPPESSETRPFPDGIALEFLFKK